jgi:probable phosphomutase (TIGR03848 family)
MTHFLLIRHGSTAATGHALSGWTPGVTLDDHGRAEVRGLCDRIARLDVSAVYTSPIERTRETAALIAAHFGLEPHVCEGAGEIRFGRWTGRAFSELAGDPTWRAFNTFRSGVRVPGGELMLEAQARFVAALVGLKRQHAQEAVVVVSHADLIKAALAHFLGVPLDLFQRIEISPASLSVLVLSEHGAHVLCVNDTGTVPAPRRTAPG